MESQVWRDGGFGGQAAEELEDENTRLKRLLADAMLDNAALKDLLGKVTPAAKRNAVAHLMDAHGMSERLSVKPSAAAA
jgi:hypothetical protein